MAVLEPNDRKLLSEGLRPPEGYSFDSAVAATYTLDLTTLLTVPLHLVRFAAENQGQALADGIALLEALQRTSRRLTVWCQAGAIGAPSMPHVLYSLLETSVVPVHAPGGGAFHPKFWLLRFVAPTGAVRLRLLVSSRNLTADRSWDTMLWLDGEVSTRDHASNSPLVDLLLALPNMAVAPIAEPLRERMAAQAAELRRATWELPANVDEFTFEVLGLRRQAWSAPPSHELVVVSPFVDAAALLAVLKSTGRGAALISRSDALDALPVDILRRFDAVKVLDEAAETESGDDSAAAAAETLRGLHAKICLAARGWYTSVVVGSANATSPAWLTGKNIELVVTLTGKRSKLAGISEFLGADGLGNLLMDYRRADVVPEPDEAELAAEQALEAAQAALVGAGLHLRCSGEGDAWTLEVWTPNPLKLVGLKAVRAWAVSLRYETAVDASGLATCNAVALPVLPMASVTGLLAFELEAQAASRKIRFVLNLPVEGLPAERDAALVRAIVANREGFLRYLLMLLGGDDEFASLTAGNHGAAQAWRSTGSGGEIMPLLEQLTRAWAHGRHEELLAIDRLVVDLQKTEAGREVIPIEFMAVWATFRQALASARGEGA